MGWTTFARFAEPGHAATGDRRSTAARKRAKVGHDVCHAIVDDHSRLGYAELLPDARARTVTGFLERALASFAIRAPQADAAILAPRAAVGAATSSAIYFEVAPGEPSRPWTAGCSSSPSRPTPSGRGSTP